MATEPLQSDRAGKIESRVPFDAYTKAPGVNISLLKELRRSPLHYQHAKTTPKESDALNLGNAAHVAILEPHRFERDHAVWSKRTEAGSMAPRKGKAWDEFVGANAGKRVITIDEHDKIRGMQRAVRGHMGAMRYLESGDPEVSMSWRLGKRVCKGRVDWLTVIDDAPHVVGLKTARDCRHFPFASQAARLGYHLQWAWYFDGYEAITGTRARMIEIVVESAPPHAVAVYVIPSDIIQQGRDEYQALLETLTHCELTGAYPGPVPVEEELTLPSWVYGSEDDDVSDLGLE